MGSLRLDWPFFKKAFINLPCKTVLFSMHSSAKAGHFLIMVFLENKAEGATDFFGKKRNKTRSGKGKGAKNAPSLNQGP